MMLSDATAKQLDSCVITATDVNNLDAIAEFEAHDYCFANCFQTCQDGPFSVDFTEDLVNITAVRTKALTD